MDLGALNKASANIGVFDIRILRPQLETYSFVKNNQTMQGQHFKCLLVGLDEACYCLGTLRGTKEATNKALIKFQAFTMWTLKNVAFDVKYKVEFVSCPVKLVVNMGTSTLEPCQNDALPQMIKPPFSLAQIEKISSNLYVDVLGVVKEVRQRQSYNDRERILVDLVDNTRNHENVMVMVTVSIWDAQGAVDGLVGQVAETVGKAIVLTAIRSTYKDSILTLSSTKGTEIIQHPTADFSSLDAAEPVAAITVVGINQTDWATPADHTCCNVLSHLSGTSGLFQARFLKHGCLKTKNHRNHTNVESHSRALCYAIVIAL